MNSELKVIMLELRDLKRQLQYPEFINKSRIAQIWGYTNQNQLKLWQLPNFGLPKFFNGKSPMYKETEVYEVVVNPEHYKQKWNRLTVKEKQEIRAKFLKLKEQEAILCH